MDEGSPPARPPSPSTPAAFRRELGTLDVASIVVGMVVGSGIFVVPGRVAEHVGPPGLVLALWGVAALISLAGALSFAELASMYPSSGGIYTYLREAYGPLPAFLYGWTVVVGISSAVIAALGLALGEYFLAFLGHPVAGAPGVAAAAVALLVTVNVLGLRFGKGVQNLFTMGKLLGFLLLVGAVFAYRSPLEVSAAGPAPSGAAPSWGAVGAALVAIIWTFDGWTYAGFVSEETREPERDLPRGLAVGIAVAAGVFLCVNLAYYSALSVPEIRSSSSLAVDALERVAGGRSAVLVALLVTVALTGSLNAALLTGPRCLAVMAREGLMPRGFARVPPRFGTPAVAIVAQGALGVVFTFVGGFYQLLALTVTAAWIFYGATAAAVLVLRRRSPLARRPYRVPAAPLVPLAFCVAAMTIVASAVVAEPLHAAIGFGLVFLGLPFYRAVQLRPEAAASR